MNSGVDPDPVAALFISQGPHPPDCSRPRPKWSVPAVYTASPLQFEQCSWSVHCPCSVPYTAGYTASKMRIHGIIQCAYAVDTAAVLTTSTVDPQCALCYTAPTLHFGLVNSFNDQ